MDKTTLAQRLMQAEEHVARGELDDLRRQRRIVELLEQQGSHRAAAAKALLQGFETSQNALIADRDRIERQLAEIAG